MADVAGSWFTDARDAADYLSEVGKVWLVWVVTLGMLAFFQQWWVLVAVAFAFLFAVTYMARPLQARARRLADGDDQIGSPLENAMGRGSKRDVAFRRLLYGSGPLREAVDLTGSSRIWLTMRWVMIFLTIFSFLWVVANLFSTPA